MLKAGGIAAASVSLAGCEPLIGHVAREIGEAIPASIGATSEASIDPAFHLLSRAAFGPRPGDVDRVRSMGDEAWIDEQLAPDAIDDTACDLRARRFETIHHDPALCYEYKKPVLREELARHTLLRAVYSRRQLFEVMVGFWSDHFNVSIDKGDCVYLKATDDRTVIRAHALGRFRDLVGASSRSPAMLVYLDGKENAKRGPEDAPNENYARELLELHTLGVDGGYTQRDVAHVARALTGWRLRTTWAKGTVYFDPALHDDGEKLVLGERIAPGGGSTDFDAVLDIVCSHPSTARHIATKLVRKLVGESEPPSLVDRVAKTFADAGGEIAPMVRQILTSDEFRASAGAKLKRPFELVASALRATGADTHAHDPLLEYLRRLGQSPFAYPTPDGYPDEAAPWLGTLLWRWNFAIALASGAIEATAVPTDALVTAIGASTPDAIFSYFTGRRATDEERDALVEFASRGCGSVADLVGIVLASPAFQRH
jgi:uncharacterized protein (DUF1800 family)